MSKTIGTSMSNLAILSPYENRYSETFIHAHRSLPFNISFICNGTGYVPAELGGTTQLTRLINKIYFKFKSIVNTKLTRAEHSLKYLLKNKKIDCILAEYGVTAAGSLNVIQSLNIPLIVHFHGFDASDKKVLSKYKQKYLEVFQYAKFVVAVSKKMSNDLMILGCPPDKIVLNACGPNSTFFNIKPSFNKKYFTAIGRFVDKKAPHLTITAFSKVAKQYADAKLFMVGSGKLLSTCEDLVRNLGIEKQVSFLGKQSREQIATLLTNTLAFVQHSVTAESGDTEGTPVAVMEASAAGLPVIATRHAGIPDVIEHDVTGFLVEEFDVATMARYMLDLCDNSEKARTLGKKGSEHIKQNFTIEKHLNCLTELIAKTITS